MKDTFTLSDAAPACSDVECWIICAAASKQPIPKSLIDAYVDTDVLRALPFLGLVISTSMEPDGNCSPELMEAFRELNTSGAGPTSLSPDPGFRFLDRAFDAVPPVVSGWTWLALNSLLRAIDAGRAVDHAMLQNLDAADPWVGAYVRWTALMKQARIGVLDPAYLNAVNKLQPEAAVIACKAAFESQIAHGRPLTFVYLRIVAARDARAAEELGKRAKRQRHLDERANLLAIALA